MIIYLQESEKLLLQKTISRYKIDQLTGCWMGENGKDKDGYCQQRWKNKNCRSHRLSFLFHNGYIDSDLQVQHSCNTPACRNPAHLSLGTPKQNMDDKFLRGRANMPRGDKSGSRKHPESRARGARHGAHTKPWTRRYGERNGHCKLTLIQINEILSLCASGTKRVRVAEMYKIHQCHISRIVGGKRRSKG